MTPHTYIQRYEEAYYFHNQSFWGDQGRPPRWIQNGLGGLRWTGGQARVRARVGGQCVVRLEPHKEGTAIKGGSLTLLLSPLTCGTQEEEAYRPQKSNMSKGVTLLPKA